ncbi:putative 1-aminocyclopropane-1-carboxylate synthase [Helianthus annuus]|nr:putative 1-aminocyclopropane-1-carboxylate synthase [Helianthus annuus]
MIKVYVGTVTNSDEFVSIAEVIMEEPECNLDLIQLVYSLFKDIGFPEFGVGIVYSYNSDNKFIDAFIPESRIRLACRHDMFNRQLGQVGIGSLESKAGVFLWVDPRRFLKGPTFESEMTFWRIIIKELKLNVSPGQSFHCSEPGWFRVCFANTDDKTTMNALRRIKCFVLHKRSLNNQHLRLSSRRFKDMLTPHSPLVSPLVRARN